MADVGKKTGKKTQAGRDVYKTPEGEFVSEKSTTFKYKGKWINVPTIFRGKSYDEETLSLMLDQGLIKPTSTHETLEEALSSAKERTDSLKFNEGGMADNREIAGFDMSDMEFYTPETGVDQQMSEAFNATPVEDKPSPLSRRPGFRGESAFDFSGFGDFLKENVSEDEIKAGLDNAGQWMVPFYESGSNMVNVVTEYMKPEEERDYEYIKDELGKAGESAAVEGAMWLLGGVAAKYGGKGIKYLYNKVKQYEIDPNTMSAFGVGSIRKKAPVDRAADVVEAERLLDDPEALANWQKIEGGKGQRQKNPESSEAAAEALYQGEITSKEARKIIEDAIPSPELYTAENMPTMPTVTEVVGSLGKKAGKYGILGVKGFDLKAGQQVSSRLDIPAYNNYDKWVVSIHDGLKDAGSVVGFGQAIRLKNIRFGSKSKDSLDIARRKVLKEADLEKGTPEKRMGKSTIARIFGEYVPEDPYKLQEEARRLLSDPESGWTQVGMNPYRKSAFYDKATGNPVFEADEVIQVGPLVLAKNVKKATISQMKEMGVRTKDGKIRMFNEGGEVMNMQKQMSLFEYGGIADDGMKKDPVSGNAIPPGSMASEVRDDIPAMLSEGEYVVPADVLRYYGVNFFEGLRNKAKQGLQTMEQDGRIGGEPLTPQQIQQNMGKAPQAGQPAPMPVQAADGVLTQLDPYMKQAQQLGGGQQFNPDQWSTVGGSTFTQQPTQDSVTTFKTFVNAQTGEKQVLEFVDGKLKNPAMEKYTVPPYYEFGSSALKKAQQGQQQPSGSGDDNGGPEPTKPDQVKPDWGSNIDWTDPLAYAKTLDVGKLEKLGGIGTSLAGAAFGPAGMLAAGVAQTGMGLNKISDLRAASIIARAQGMEDQAKQIDTAVEKYLSQSNNAVNFLDDLVATGTKKAESVLDRLNLKYTRDPKTNKITFTPEDAKYNSRVVMRDKISNQAQKDTVGGVYKPGGIDVALGRPQGDDSGDAFDAAVAASRARSEANRTGMEEAIASGASTENIAGLKEAFEKTGGTWATGGRARGGLMTKNKKKK